MPNLDTLKSIQSRLEALEGADREVDAAIFVELCQPEPIKDDETRRYRMPHVSLDHMDQCAPGTYWYVQRSGKSLQTAPRLTSSIDAIVSLIEEKMPGCSPGVGQNVHHKHWHAHIASLSPDRVPFDVGEADAPAPALALALAFIKALIQMEEGNG